jgi:NTE family protein
VLDFSDNEVRSLRKQQLINFFTAAEKDAVHRKGTYWSIRSNIKHYELDDTLDCPFERTLALAETPTRLKRMDDDLQVINRTPCAKRRCESAWTILRRVRFHNLRLGYE